MTMTQLCRSSGTVQILDFLELDDLSQGLRKHLYGPAGHLKSEGQYSIFNRSIFKFTFEFRVKKSFENG